MRPASEFDFLDPDVLEVLSARSPGDRYRLVFDSYQGISEEDGEIEIGGEPDSAPLLIDERTGRAQVFEFCGTPCGYDWGCWVDSVRFALGGWAEIDDRGDSLRGVLGIYSLADSMETRYFTRPVSREEFGKYVEAWRAWARSRYLAWKSAAVARRN